MRALALVTAVVAGCVAPLPPCTDGVCDEPPALGDDGSGTLADDGSSASATEDSDTPPGPICGDGRLEGAEICDDGNLVDGDGCNADCDVSLRMLDLVVLDDGEQDRAIGLDIGVDGDGDIVVVGTARRAGLDAAFVVGLDPALAERFVDVPALGSMGTATSRAFGVAVNEAGFAAVAGDVSDAEIADVLLRFYDPTGALSWETTFDGPDALEDRASAIVFDPFGQLYAVGQTARLSGDGAALLLQYTPDGVKVGDQVIDPPVGSDLDPLALAYAVPSRLVVSGVEAGPMSSEIFVSSIDLDPFAEIRVNDGTASLGARSSAVAVDPAGEIVAVGADAEHAWAAKYALDLAVVWMVRLDQSGDPRELFDVVIVPEDGSIYVVGDVAPREADNDVLVAHLDPEGGEIGRAVHDLGGLHDSARGLARAPDGTLLLTGETETPAGFHPFVLRVAP